MIETILIISIILLLIWSTSKQKPKNFPPGPTRLPLLGNLISLNYHDAQAGWEYLHKYYGDITGMVVPKYKFVVVSGWKAVMEVLGNEDMQGRPDACLLRDRFDGGRYGLIFKDGEEWKVQRRFTLHHFRNLGFGRKSHESVVLEETERLADEIEALNGAPFQIEPLVGISAINITWHVIGGQRYDRNDPVLLKLVSDVKEMVHSVSITGSPAVMFPFIRYLFPQRTGYKSIKHSCEGILKFVRESVQKQMKNMTEEKSENENSFVGIYLQKMFSPTSEKDPSFTMGQLEGICMDLLAAGSDTSSSVLSFAVLFLCLKEEMQEKIFSEIQTVIGTHRMPTYDDKAKLVFTNAFISEVLRFRYVVPTYPPHLATRDTKLMDYNIPKGTALILNVRSIFTDVDYWGDPETFRPERFITHDFKLRSDERMIIFGKGKRSCLGETLAKMSSFLMFVSLVQRFKFSFPEGEIPQDTEGTVGFTVGPPDFKVIASPRRQKN